MNLNETITIKVNLNYTDTRQNILFAAQFKGYSPTVQSTTQEIVGISPVDGTPLIAVVPCEIENPQMPEEYLKPLAENHVKEKLMEFIQEAIVTYIDNVMNEQERQMTEAEIAKLRERLTIQTDIING